MAKENRFAGRSILGGVTSRAMVRLDVPSECQHMKLDEAIAAIVAKGKEDGLLLPDMELSQGQIRQMRNLLQGNWEKLQRGRLKSIQVRIRHRS